MTGHAPRGSSEYDRFTDRAMRVMGAAQRRAAPLPNGFVLSEHILHALTTVATPEPCLAAHILGELDVDVDGVRRDIESSVPTAAERLESGPLPDAPEAGTIIGLARAEAKALTHNYLGTEHLLLGLLRHADGSAARILSGHGVTLDAARACVIRLLGYGVP